MTITDMTIAGPNLPLTTEEIASSECYTHMTVDTPKFTIQDAYGENASTAVEFLHQDTILKLPTTIKAGLAGNAATATKLLNARTINGAAFDGSKNIEINNLVGAGNSKFYYVKAPPYTEISPSADDSEYFKELLKWICTKYPTAVDSIFIAPANPNGKGTVIIHIYECAKVQDGIPQWSSGFYESVAGRTYVFRTNNYNYEFTENTFSTLPINKGGTGATTASGALTNLGAAAKTDLNKYLPLAGGTMTGTIINNMNSNNLATGVIQTAYTSNTHIGANKGAAIINSTASGTSYNMLAKMNSTNGVWTLGSYGKEFHLFWTNNETITAGTNATTKNLVLLDEDGNSKFPRSCYCNNI